MLRDTQLPSQPRFFLISDPARQDSTAERQRVTGSSPATGCQGPRRPPGVQAAGGGRTCQGKQALIYAPNPGLDLDLYFQQSYSKMR